MVDFIRLVLLILLLYTGYGAFFKSNGSSTSVRIKNGKFFTKGTT